jgi:hypothetical protein
LKNRGISSKVHNWSCIVSAKIALKQPHNNTFKE